MDYEKIEKIKAAILASNSIEELRASGMMPPVPQLEDTESYVFISYSHQDYKSVYCDLVEFYRNKIRYWYDAELRHRPGLDWDAEVEKRIKDKNCAGILFYLSENLFMSKSVYKEIAFTLGIDSDESKKYFCINICGKRPTEILIDIIRDYNKDVLEKVGFRDRMSNLLSAFTDKGTDIGKSSPDYTGHIQDTVEAFQSRFGVIAADSPFFDNESVAKLQSQLDLATTFSVKDGVLFKYLGHAPEVVIPNGVTEIGEGAFKDCKHVTSVKIPEGVTSIGSEAFNGCTGLESITVAEGNTAYLSSGNCLIKRSTQTLLLGCKNSAIPDDGSVEIIGLGAFSGCAGLKSITIPASVMYIGGWSSFGCTGLESITVAEGNTVYYSSGNCLIERSTKTLLLGCNNSVIPTDGSVEIIGARAFSHCTGLKSITIPDSVELIDWSAFEHCTGLESISIPNRVTSIGYCAFGNCKHLKKITYTGTKAQWVAIKKGAYWDLDIHDYTVHCTDGDIRCNK